MILRLMRVVKTNESDQWIIEKLTSLLMMIYGYDSLFEIIRTEKKNFFRTEKKLISLRCFAFCL